MTILFISDLHLSPLRPDITDCFLDFMNTEAIHAEKLYVLGDLFEFWIGDDDNSPFNVVIKEAFKALTQHGVKCYFIQGNRDFLLNKRFCKETGVQLLADHTVIDINNEKVLIMHGDTLCIDDIKYQEFRAKVHQPWLQWVFNRIPLFIRQRIVKNVQDKIKEKKQHKKLTIMDVTQSEVERVMRQEGVKRLIHGHTHRPNVHTFNHNSEEMTRIVLGDWYTQGSILEFKNNKYTLQNKSFK
ncbi:MULTISPECIES: UDP-2,3-diacylglucosamine diphosphatase [Aliivibrio]|uniref:UDP-2,3-diacylglucosamine hydrolase n=1 Tax=Aliivibrio finisterrensis TaxID=511998 RepID=A0A4Q5KW08_9GAMM|nr:MULTISPECIES: UDP-2,3-diacylglucosamine diphosphatase [Aliivibrio]MDD9179196.1 UDP-2,3-diacylglucosamine diphosphatase [Aliivibrio sp. A6]RYU52898.1 UDP-2,3-diacylglucosamine diphosphatase [Aliivibrio finisterrensis]RYU54623.1 UDP-2,3-diacylglucosamine diphosphatase [Aliivibrio finisterrensis]RYU57868.1 UDP-2,3-diacylglucosamine diphosphatase [Aliivibrio finisterrensis]RYU65296.1 UDP-2,3-diacylglucosamine diphosphatase [Aliivibrio finisterrensis]